MNYKITDTISGKIYKGSVWEVERLTGIDRKYYNWYATQEKLFGFRYRIERVR